MPKHWIDTGCLYYTTILRDISEENGETTILGISVFQVTDTTILTIGIETLPLCILATHLGRELATWS